MKLLDSVRSVLGVRAKRSMPRVGPRPLLGAKIVRGDLRITVQAGLTAETWHWLIEQGWREETFRHDRRVYREVPSARVADLFDATDPDERWDRMQLAIAEAKVRPAVVLRVRH